VRSRKTLYSNVALATCQNISLLIILLTNEKQANMKKNKFCFGLAVMAAMLASCEKMYVVEDETGGDDGSVQGSLVVRTAANVANGASGSDYVSYPVSVYVMNADGKCVELQKISSADEGLDIKLAAGNYDVCAVAGTDNYDLPTKENATKETVISPKNGNGHGDLMTAHNSVVMAKGEENRLTLQLQRKVMQVQSITLNNIPSDVSAVQLTVSPLHKGIMLDGSYVGGTDSHTFDLAKQADGSTWKSTAGEYLLEQKSDVTLKVSLVRADGTTSYSYASDKQLAANHKINITGNFIDDEHISLSGTITGTDWEETIDVIFDFDSTNISTDGGSAGTDEKLHGEAPAAGTMYKGCYVLRTESEGNATTVTLITPTEANKIKVSSSKDADKKQQSIKENTATALDGITVSGITGWRLPTQEEMEYIDNNVESINAKISALATGGVEEIVLAKGKYSCGYFFTSDDGNVYVYVLGGNIDKSPNSERATYKVRGFATVKFTD